MGLLPLRGLLQKLFHTRSTAIISDDIEDISVDAQLPSFWSLDYLYGDDGVKFLHNFDSFWFCMVTLFLAFLLTWWIGAAFFSSSISASPSTITSTTTTTTTTTTTSTTTTTPSLSSVSNRNHSKSTSSVEAFRSVIQRRIVQPTTDRILSPLQTALSSSSNDNDDDKNRSRNRNNNNAAAASAVSSSFDYFFGNTASQLIPPGLVPPFDMLDDFNVTPEELTAVVPHPDVTHFCFLIHGHRGLSQDLAYFQIVMQREAACEKKRNGLLKDSTRSTNDVQDESQATSSSSSNMAPPSMGKRHDMVVHSSVCNEGKTTDGIENGGDRLVEEMREVIDQEMKRRYPAIGGNASDDTIYDVTISLLGNSLGGLFGRYAIAKLVERHCVKQICTIKVKNVKDDVFNSLRCKIKKGQGHGDYEDVLEEECWILDGKYRLHMNIFCSTASPHLGVSGHTWFRIPRTAEIGVAHAMGTTGKDLFRLNDLLHTMATSPTFLGPLGAFRKRIAYANCYGTDFVVPAGTAAFLSENSTYPHHFSDDYILDDKGLVIATLHTPTHNGKKDETEEHSDELHEMSSSLDKLGWKKVFVDVRKEMPSVELPKALRRASPNSPSMDDSGNSEDIENTISNSTIPVANTVDDLKKQKVVQSKDVANAMSTTVDNRVSLPLGHNMIVAFSRNRVFTYVNKAGRPIVDSLAKELVEDIFKWDEIYAGPVLHTETVGAPPLYTSSPSSPATKIPRLSESPRNTTLFSTSTTAPSSLTQPDLLKDL